MSALLVNLHKRKYLPRTSKDQITWQNYLSFQLLFLLFMVFCLTLNFRDHIPLLQMLNDTVANNVTILPVKKCKYLMLDREKILPVYNFSFINKKLNWLSRKVLYCIKKEKRCELWAVWFFLSQFNALVGSLCCTIRISCLKQRV